MTPAETIGTRGYAPYCAMSVLGAIHELADASHSKAIMELVLAGRWKGELLFTLGRVAPPRYANFIGRYKDDRDPAVREGVATALGVIDNRKVAVPVLIQLLARGDDAEFPVKWQAARSLVAVARRGDADGVRRRLVELFREPNALTAVLAAGALAETGDARGFAKLRELTRHPDSRVREEAVLTLATDRGAAGVLRPRLADESLAVRAAALYAVAKVEGATAVPALRQAAEDALAYERALERRKAGGEAGIDETYGARGYDLRETLQEALQLTGTRP